MYCSLVDANEYSLPFLVLSRPEINIFGARNWSFLYVSWHTSWTILSDSGIKLIYKVSFWFILLIYYETDKIQWEILLLFLFVLSPPWIFWGIRTKLKSKENNTNIKKTVQFQITSFRKYPVVGLVILNKPDWKQLLIYFGKHSPGFEYN